MIDNYNEIKNPVYLVLPEVFSQPLKCRLVCPYTDDTYLFEYEKDNTRHTIVAHDTSIYFTVESATEAYEKLKGRCFGQAFLADPLKYQYPVKCDIIGKTDDEIYFVDVINSSCDTLMVHGSLLFETQNEALKSYNALYNKYKEIRHNKILEQQKSFCSETKHD